MLYLIGAVNGRVEEMGFWAREQESEDGFGRNAGFMNYGVVGVADNTRQYGAHRW